MVRRPPKPSEATSPAATRSPSAARTAASSRPEAAISSGMNEAPRVGARSSTRRALVARVERRRAGSVLRRRSPQPSGLPTRRHARGGTTRSASRRPAASRRATTRTAAPSRPRRSGTACRASTADSRRRDPAGRRAPRRRRPARSRRATRATARRPSMPVSRLDGVDVLPREQEPHEVGGADRLDLRAQPVQRVAMDAREQPAVAPLEVKREPRTSRRINAPAQHHALSPSSASSAASASATSIASVPASAARGRRSERSRYVRAAARRSPRSRVQTRARATAGGSIGGSQRRVRMHRTQLGQPLGRHAEF